MPDEREPIVEISGEHYDDLDWTLNELVTESYRLDEVLERLAVVVRGLDVEADVQQPNETTWSATQRRDRIADQLMELSR